MEREQRAANELRIEKLMNGICYADSGEKWNRNGKIRWYRYEEQQRVCEKGCSCISNSLNYYFSRRLWDIELAAKPTWIQFAGTTEYVDCIYRNPDTHLAI